MSKPQLKTQKLKWNEVIPVVLIILLAAFLRIVPHPPNFAPIGALALFSGAYLSSKRAFLLPLAAMFISDLIIGFHDTMLFVYGSFFLIAYFGRFLKKRTRILPLMGTSVAASLLFFVITNFGVWMVGSMYPKTMSGLSNAYLLGLPFLRNTLSGDLVYTFSFFYGYRIIEYIVSQPHVILAKRKN